MILWKWLMEYQCSWWFLKRTGHTWHHKTSKGEHGKTFSNINCRNIFLDQSPKAKDIKAKINKWDLLLLLLSRFSPVRLCATPETAAHQAPPSLGFSRQERANLLMHKEGTPLVQRLRICLPMQGTCVPSLVGEVRPHVPWEQIIRCNHWDLLQRRPSAALNK